MSIEYPEAQILAKQLDETIKGEIVESYDIKDCEKLQKIGFVNRNLDDFKLLVGRRILEVGASGNTIRVRLDRGVNLMLAPEYGGIVLYHKSDTDAKYHLRIGFDGGGSLTVRLSSMGGIKVIGDDQLEGFYIYKRDYMGAPNPLDTTAKQFGESVASRGTQLKPILVGKDAVVTGLSNSAFQDVMWRAGIHPHRKVSELTKQEVDKLYSAIRSLIDERLRLGGKSEFVDIFGKPGAYAPRMGPSMKDRSCPRCGMKIEKMAHGGGQVYFCPGCQK